MKKMNTAAANAIVGGAHKQNCVQKYQAQGTTACNLVTTCYGKHGKVISQTSESSTLDNCGISPPAGY